MKFINFFFLFIFVIIFLSSIYSIHNKSIVNISEVYKIKLNGVNQQIYVHGNSLKPILLILHGGPGYAMSPLFHKILPNLENYFLIVDWDQRFSGNSFSKNENGLQFEYYIKDTHNLTTFLKKRYKKKKIYLLGHSFGNLIGMIVAKLYSDDYYAYISVDGAIDIIENEKLRYNLALNKAIKSQNKTATNELLKIGKPDNFAFYSDDSSYEVVDKWCSFFGGTLFNRHNSDEVDNIILDNYPYENVDKWLSGIDFSQKIFDEEAVWFLNLNTKIKSISIPIYFIYGKYDLEVVPQLIKDYYNNINAPYKKIFEFKNSSHFPFYEEPKKFEKILINISKKNNNRLLDFVLINQIKYFFQ